MLNKLKLPVLLILAMFGIASYAQTTFVVMQPDGNSGKDANVKLKDSGDNFGTVNYGTETDIKSERANATVWYKTRSLFQFDVASLPYNAKIVSANLVLYGTGSHSGSNASLLRRVVTTWDENTVTWNTQPTTSTSDEISISASSSASQTYTINVTSHVQYMLDYPHVNYGWELLLQDESTSSARGLYFGSSDNSTAALRPRLEITYEMPMEINGLVTHVNSAVGSNTGAIDVSITNGVAPYTYSWSNAATTQDISSLTSGLYTLTVTDANGFTAKKYFVVGSWGSSVTVNIKPDAATGKDNMIFLNDNGTIGATTPSGYYEYITSMRWSNRGWNKYRSSLSFDLSSIPTMATVTSSTLTLYGTDHSTLGGSNASYLQRVSGSWEELRENWSNQAGRITSDQISLSASTSATQTYSVNVATHVQKMVNEPMNNYGWALVLQDESTAAYRKLEFASSDNATSGNWPELSVTFTLPSYTDDANNYTESTTYDLNGNIVATSRNYTDNLGRATQSQLRDVYGQVYTTQTVYDSYGRPAIQSLPAPSGNTFGYNSGFMLNSSGTAYTYNNFDTPSTLNNPTAVQNTVANTLGNYYSDNGPDAFVATTSYPYSRVEYTADPLGSVKRTTQAGDTYQMGSGHEGKSFTMSSGDELRYIFGTNTSYKCSMDAGDPLTTYTTSLTGGIQAVKTILLTPDGKEIISYSAGGQNIASCMSGLGGSDYCNMTTIKNTMSGVGTQSVDIHLPSSCKSSLKLPLATFFNGVTTQTVTTSDITYSITDLNTNTVLTPTTHYTINSGTRMVTFNSPYNTGTSFFRISFTYSSGFLSALTVDPPDEQVEYTLDYGHWVVNYYDLSGKLRKSVSAGGINCSSPGTVTMASKYDYNSYGQLITSVTPDEGKSEMMYDSEGKLRFSQKASQVAVNKFSYINYDKFDRVVETGEYTAGNYGSISLYFQNYYGDHSPPFTHNTETTDVLDSIDNMNDAQCANRYFSDYDTLQSSTNIPAGYTYRSNYVDKWKVGQLNRTWNENSSTWYAYDAVGRVIATVHEIYDTDYTSLTGAGIKSNEMVYDEVTGQLKESHYQLNESAEKLSTYYTYNAQGQAVKTELTRGSSTNKEVMSRMEYYRMGAPKRMEMGNKLQGVDYVYTINGRLKSMNHPSLDESKDPGQDGKSGANNSGFAKDMFAYTLEYHAGDYSRNGSNITASAAFTTYYNGMINGIHYKTANSTNGTINGADYLDYGGANQVQLTSSISTEIANQYTYDKFGRLSTSVFGTYNNSTPAFTARTDYKEFGNSGTSGIAYDNNGNITNLQRNAYGISSVYAMDNMDYTYTSNTNKLASVTDNVTTANYGTHFSTSGTSKTFSYDNSGAMTVSQAEGVSSITYYPNGQVKKVTFTNGNYTDYFYNDRGQKYKVVYYTASGGTYVYNWYIGPCLYKKQSNSVVLEEATLAGAVLKNTGTTIDAGELHFALTDHLGNVRVTFKRATNGVAELVSRNDFYVYGGVMPGRSYNPTQFNFGYQAKEKAKDDSRWDQFELRLFNHDLGRWFAPDPYREFSSSYIGMGNNPVNAIDPNGGQINYLHATQGQLNAGNSGISGLKYSQILDAALQANAVYNAELSAILTTINGVQDKIVHSMATTTDILVQNLAVYDLRAFYHKYNQDNMNSYDEGGLSSLEVRAMSNSGTVGLWSNAVNIDDDNYTFSVWRAVDNERRALFYTNKAVNGILKELKLTSEKINAMTDKQVLALLSDINENLGNNDYYGGYASTTLKVFRDMQSNGNDKMGWVTKQVGWVFEMDGNRTYLSIGSFGDTDEERGNAWKHISNGLDYAGNNTNPAMDWVIGATEDKIASILLDRAKYGRISGQTIIRTKLTNIHVSTGILKTGGAFLKGTGWLLGGLGLYGTYSQWQSGEIGNGEATADMVMGVVGFVPGVGWIISSSYFIVGKPWFGATQSAIPAYNEAHPIDQPGNLIYHICFAKETLVKSKRGMVSIDSIVKGDSVYSYNEKANTTELSAVTDVFTNSTDEIYELVTTTQKILVTSEHPFCTINGKWVPVKHLKEGDNLKSCFSDINEVVISLKLIKKTIIVYNIEVSGNHNYFITNSNILVHNKHINPNRNQKFNRN